MDVPAAYNALVKFLEIHLAEVIQDIIGTNVVHNRPPVRRECSSRVLQRPFHDGFLVLAVHNAATLLRRLF